MKADKSCVEETALCVGMQNPLSRLAFHWSTLGAHGLNLFAGGFGLTARRISFFVGLRLWRMGLIFADT